MFLLCSASHHELRWYQNPAGTNHVVCTLVHVPKRTGNGSSRSRESDLEAMLQAPGREARYTVASQSNFKNAERAPARVAKKRSFGAWKVERRLVPLGFRWFCCLYARLSEQRWGQASHPACGKTRFGAGRPCVVAGRSYCYATEAVREMCSFSFAALQR